MRRTALDSHINALSLAFQIQRIAIRLLTLVRTIKIPRNYYFQPTPDEPSRSIAILAILCFIYSPRDNRKWATSWGM